MLDKYVCFTFPLCIPREYLAVALSHRDPTDPSNTIPQDWFLHELPQVLGGIDVGGRATQGSAVGLGDG